LTLPSQGYIISFLLKVHIYNVNIRELLV